MLINNIWRCTAQAFSNGIWAKGPLGPKYQFYQNTYCLSKDIGNRTPLTFIIFNEQIRSRFLDIKSFNYLRETWHSHLKVKYHVWSSHLVTQSFVWRCVLLCVFIPPTYCDQDESGKKKGQKKTHIFFLIIMTIKLAYTLTLREI